MPPLIDRSKCVACGVCIEICPLQVFRKDRDNGTPVIAYGDECWHCNSCVLDCKENAISLRIPANFMMLNVEASSLKPKEM